MEPKVKRPADVNGLTIKMLKEAIPEKCFNRSFLQSFSYIIRDFLLSVVVTALYIKFVPVEMPELMFNKFLWILTQLVWFWIQGGIWTGFWVIGHECGHHAFCTVDIISDIFGFIIHSLLLVPFFSWSYTHGMHHKNNNNLLTNETHQPPTGKGFAKVYGYIFDLFGEDGYAIVRIFVTCFWGWPLYIFFGISGCRETPNGTRLKGLHSHFIPNTNAFHKNFPSWKVWLSTAGVGSVIFGLYKWILYRGWSEVIRHYIGPYLIVNFWLVLYTWLHHTHPSIPHYGTDKWHWLLGCMSTIDRDYGIFDYLHHDIGSTHVVHHLFSKIPHYHAKEATEKIKVILGNQYKYSNQFWLYSLWETAKTCHFVEGLTGTQFYKIFRPHQSVDA